MSLDELIDLSLAWERVRTDLSLGRVFVQHPHEQAIIEENARGWIIKLKDDIREGRYAPSAMYIANIPKPNGAIRPGGCLTIRDQVVYAALVGSMLARIRDAMFWSDKIVDFSYPIAKDLTKTKWLESTFPLWRDFANKSVEKIDEGYSFVLLADIAGYYEQIDFEILVSDLRSLGIEDTLCKQLSACLNRWSMSATPGRGLPQGFSSSDILGRLYLTSIDRALNERGLLHYRYVDDFRIFTKSEKDALSAFVELISLLRRRGLAIQSDKSLIHEGSEAKEIILGIQPVLQKILIKFDEEIEMVLAISSSYLSSWELEQLIISDPDLTPIEVIKTAYQEYFIDAPPKKFNKTLFHFLLNKLGQSKDRFAFPHVMSLLEAHPEETEPVLKYLLHVATTSETDPLLLKVMRSVRSVYPYQLYQIIRWRNSRTEVPTEEFIKYIREVTFETKMPPFARATCRELLAKWGSSVDLDRLEESLQTASSELEKAELVCCLRRMEHGRRNSINSRIAAEGEQPARAARLVKAGRL